MELQNDYSKFTNDELIKKGKKLKTYNIIATIVCFLAVVNVLVGIYINKNRGAFTVFLILVSMFLMFKFGSELKKIQEELKNRN